MKKIKMIVMLCALLTINLVGQNSYGEFSYQHTTDTELSCGLTATNAPGFVLAGFNASSSTFNFSIDRTSMGGAFVSNPCEFQEEYQIWAEVSSCSSGSEVQITTCHGISIIESKVASLQSEYALVASFDEGCLFTFLDLNGAPINSNAYFFPFPSTNAITKPLIIEDPNNPSTYFICGSYNNTLYALQVDINGSSSSFWSRTYPINGQPRAMTLSTGGDPVIVGKTSANGTVDGFILHLDASNGVIVAFKSYDVGGLIQEFSSIAPSNVGSGYIIGGTCETATNFFRSYVMLITTNLNTINFRKVFTSNADITASNVVGIIERPTNYSWTWEFYAAISSTAGIIVQRLDNVGDPVNVTYTMMTGEFVYNAPGANITAGGISFFNSGAGYDEGLHIFGTDANSTPTQHYLAKAYFSGESGCNTPNYPLTSFTVNTISTPITTLTTGTGLSACNAVYLVNSISSSFNTNCGPASSVSGASNQRQSPTGMQNTKKSTDFVEIYPNPVKSELHLKLNGEKIRTGKIEVFSILGQNIYSIDLAKNIDNEKTEIVIDFEKLNIETGIYSIKVNANGINSLQKINYVK